MIPVSAFGSTAISEFDFSSIKVIEERAFVGTQLREALLLRVTLLGEYVFYRSQLESVSFGMLNTIPSHAFERCTNLKTIDLKNVETIETDAFSGCGIESLIFPASVQTLQTHAFENTKLQTVTYESTVPNLSDSAFSGSTCPTVLLATAELCQRRLDDTMPPKRCSDGFYEHWIGAGRTQNDLKCLPCTVCDTYKTRCLQQDNAVCAIPKKIKVGFVAMFAFYSLYGTVGALTYFYVMKKET